MSAAPRHLRFARALALLSGLGACASSAPPPAAPAPPPTTTGSALPNPCARCTCDYSSTNPPSCYALGRNDCCTDYATVEGPLRPPDLPA